MKQQSSILYLLPAGFKEPEVNSLTTYFNKPCSSLILILTSGIIEKGIELSSGKVRKRIRVDLFG